MAQSNYTAPLDPFYKGLYWPTLGELQLDIVGFLAVLGEASVLENAQVASLSRWSLLPRLMPAPQALLRTNRPARMQGISAKVFGVQNGGYTDTLTHFAAMIHSTVTNRDGGELEDYQVRCIIVSANTRELEPSSSASAQSQKHRSAQHDASSQTTTSSSEHGISRDKNNVHLRHINVQRTETAIGIDIDEPDSPGNNRMDGPVLTSKAKVRPRVSAKGFINIVPMISFLMTIALVILAIWLEDSWSLVATPLLAFLSSLCGFSNKWTPKFQERKASNKEIPPSDVVVQYPNGSFLIIKCEEEVARMLYWTPADCEYLIPNGWSYRILALIGTIMLMGGIIFLANARIEMQIAWSGAYITINSLYWLMAALPPRSHWDLSDFKIKEVVYKMRKPFKEPLPIDDGPKEVHRHDSQLLIEHLLKKLRNVWTTKKSNSRSTLPQHHDKETLAQMGGSPNGPDTQEEHSLRLPGKKVRSMKTVRNLFDTECETFTQALWVVIAITRSKMWAEKHNVAPDTPQWRKWLQKAEDHAKIAGAELDELEKARKANEKRLVNEESDDFFKLIPTWDPAKEFMECRPAE